MTVYETEIDRNKKNKRQYVIRYNYNDVAYINKNKKKIKIYLLRYTTRLFITTMKKDFNLVYESEDFVKIFYIDFIKSHKPYVDNNIDLVIPMLIHVKDLEYISVSNILQFYKFDNPITHFTCIEDNNYVFWEFLTDSVGNRILFTDDNEAKIIYNYQEVMDSDPKMTDDLLVGYFFSSPGRHKKYSVFFKLENLFFKVDKVIHYDTLYPYKIIKESGSKKTKDNITWKELGIE